MTYFDLLYLAILTGNENIAEVAKPGQRCWTEVPEDLTI